MRSAQLPVCAVARLVKLAVPAQQAMEMVDDGVEGTLLVRG